MITSSPDTLRPGAMIPSSSSLSQMALRMPWQVSRVGFSKVSSWSFLFNSESYKKMSFIIQNDKIFCTSEAFHKHINICFSTIQYPFRILYLPTNTNAYCVPKAGFKREFLRFLMYKYKNYPYTTPISSLKYVFIIFFQNKADVKKYI